MKISKFLIPVLVIVALLGGHYSRLLFTQPTTATTIGSGEGKKLECIVDGVRCKGTAQFFASLYEGVDGINGIETYASDHRVVFTFDPKTITPDRIRSIMEAPIPLRDGTSEQIFRCRSMEEN